MWTECQARSRSIAVETLRSQFWTAALAHMQQKPPAFAAVDQLLRTLRGGRDLIEAPSPAGVLQGMDHPVGGPPGEHDRGPRCFLIEWEPGSITDIHGHPPLMYMAVISGALSIDEFERPQTDGKAALDRTSIIETGGAVHRVATNDRWDNFIHRIHTTAPTWSLHIYGDDSGLGVRFDDQGNPVQSGSGDRFIGASPD
jgi:hypothetical protein